MIIQELPEAPPESFALWLLLMAIIEAIASVVTAVAMVVLVITVKRGLASLALGRQENSRSG